MKSCAPATHSYLSQDSLQGKENVPLSIFASTTPQRTPVAPALPDYDVTITPMAQKGGSIPRAERGTRAASDAPGVNTYDVCDGKSIDDRSGTFGTMASAPREMGPPAALTPVHCYQQLPEWNGVHTIGKSERKLHIESTTPGVNTYDTAGLSNRRPHAVISQTEHRLAPVDTSVPGVNTYDTAKYLAHEPSGAGFDHARRELGPPAAATPVHSYVGLETWQGELTIEPKLPQRVIPMSDAPGVNTYDPQPVVGARPHATISQTEPRLAPLSALPLTPSACVLSASP